MRKMMRICAAAAIVAAGPLAAQEAAPPTAPADAATPAEMSPEQMRVYGLWPQERQAMFDGWSEEAKSYYWTLTPPRQEVFWMLSDVDRLTLTGMAEDEQETAWSRLEQQMLASQPPVGSAPDAPSAPPEPIDEPMADPMDRPMTEVDDHSPS